MVSRSGKNSGLPQSLLNTTRKRDAEAEIQKRDSTHSELRFRRTKSLGDLTQVEVTFSGSTASPIDLSRFKATSSTPLSQLTMLEKKGEPDLATLEEMQPYASASNFLYSNLNTQIPSGWKQVKPSDGMMQQFTEKVKGIEIDKNGNFSTKEGLVASLFITDKAELCLAFGGTTAGEVTGKLMARTSGNFSKTTHQWIANAKNAILGIKPQIYEQAANLASALTKVNEISFDTVKINPLELYAKEIGSPPSQAIKLSSPKLTLTGHSLGGGLAQYAAVTVGTTESPMRCYGFCSAELGREIQSEIKEKTRNDPEKHQALVSQIKNLKIKGDFVPNMHNIFSKISNLGESYTIAPLAEKESGVSKWIDAHINFLNHLSVNTLIKKSQQILPEDQFDQL